MDIKSDFVGQRPGVHQMVVEYSSDYEQAWSEYVEKSPESTVTHEIGWRDVISDSLGHEPRYLLALDGSTVKGILPLFLVTTWWRAKYLISVPWLDYGGICADDDKTAGLLLDEASRITDRIGARFLELRSVKSNNLGMAERLDKASLILKLNEDPDALWKAMNAKLRNQIRKSEKSGLTTEIGGIEFLDDFYKVFSRNMRDLGTPVWGKDLIGNTLRRFPDDAEIILVRHQNVVVAGGLILTFKETQYVPSASAYRWSLKYCPNMALYWAVIKRACERGYRYFDFGRSSWDSGTFRFKKQWGATPEQLVWQYYLNKEDDLPRITPENPKYKLAVRLWKKMPMPIANILGPRIIKNFP